MNPINERLPALLPLAIPHLVTPRVIEAAAAYCVGMRGEAVRGIRDYMRLPDLDYAVARCLNWSSEGAATEICRALLDSLIIELNLLHGISSSSATPP